jgi:hypothetical protein
VRRWVVAGLSGSCEYLATLFGPFVYAAGGMRSNNDGNVVNVYIAAGRLGRVPGAMKWSGNSPRVEH